MNYYHNFHKHGIEYSNSYRRFSTVISDERQAIERWKQRYDEHLHDVENESMPIVHSFLHVFDHDHLIYVYVYVICLLQTL